MSDDVTFGIAGKLKSDAIERKKMFLFFFFLNTFFLFYYNSVNWHSVGLPFLHQLMQLYWVIMSSLFFFFFFNDSGILVALNQIN